MSSNLQSLFYGLVICCIVSIIFLLSERVSPWKKNKKAIWFVRILTVLVFGGFVIGQAVLLNPPVEAKLKSTSLQFKKEENVSFRSITSMHYFTDPEMEIVANGFRWGNKDYYSGDANVRITDTEPEYYFYKCKVYIHTATKPCIVVETEEKAYVFNLATKKETKQFYDQLEEKTGLY